MVTDNNMRVRNLNTRGGRVYIWLGVILIFLGAYTNIYAGEYIREYRLKAGFLYKFLDFAEWPPKKNMGTEFTIIIGIMGEDSFGDAFDLVVGESKAGKRLLVRRYNKDTPVDELKRCKVLFISPNLKDQVHDILKMLDGFPVLTVSEMPRFGQNGGMINFVMIENRVAFEINKKAAERVGIILSSKLLRVAARVIKDEWNVNKQRNNNSNTRKQ
jgi:YfiR/HmsC-like